MHVFMYNHVYVCMIYIHVFLFISIDGCVALACASSGERQFKALPASARSPAYSQAFPSTLATFLCSSTAKSRTTATVTATRPATTRFPKVSVLIDFQL